MKTNDITSEEIYCENGKKMLILTYAGEGDPVQHLDDAVREYVKRDKYTQFVDANMDNPWVRVILKEESPKNITMKNLLSKEQIKDFLDAFEKKVGRKTAIFDLDGVVADWEPLAIEHSKRLGVSVEEFKDKKLYRNIQGFYYDLELIPGAKESIMKLDEVYDIIFVSAPSWGNIHCFTEKRMWIEKHFGKWAEKKMDLSFHKGHYIGHYLIDDRTKYGAGEFIGEHIMFGTTPFENWEKVTNYLLK